MKEKYRILLSILAGILLVVGLALTFNEPIKDWLVQQNQTSKLESINKDAIKKAEASDGDFDFSKVKSIDLAQIAKSKTDNTAQVLGVLAIPKVKMKLPILKGLSDAALSSGGGTMRPDQKMGKGNYPLAGHYMTNQGILFSPLEQVNKGDKIYISDLDKVYTYKINMKKIVDPYQVWLVDNTDQKMITLITCADGGVNRWAVRGKLISTKKATKKTMKVFDLKHLL